MSTDAEQAANAFFSAIEDLDDEKVERLFADHAGIRHSFGDKTQSKGDILNNIRQGART